MGRVCSISELPKHNCDIYVIGSGNSLDYIDKSFFDGKICVGMNYAHLYFPLTYSISHHHEHVQDMINQGVITVTSEYDMCMFQREIHHLEGDYFIYKHKAQGFVNVDFSDFDNPESLACGGTIATSAIHLAFRLGATSIILCGLDGGSLDGNWNYSGYNDPTNIGHTMRVQPQIDAVSNLIRERGVGVYSMNPFTNFRLEGHTFAI